ncbi:hypothetical protein Pcinc_029541 [Petrolisthes cinctipes]|uniref:Transposase n=1 Tax=Petrolisthes cinctipes TaxID=88211 RepID=A0AAE1F0P7_PETCI|nr:hypothetical protein Pcinc_029541 [Petrolisthes cinctipes]
MDRRNVQKVAQRARMVGMHEAGLSPHQIAADLGVHETTVYCWLKRWEEEDDLTDHRRPGPARKTTAEEDRRLQEYIEAQPFSNAVAARRDLQLPVTSETDEQYQVCSGACIRRGTQWSRNL